ncbi:uncharacterized protein LOC122301650 [Carya illinoinensis]|uniref:uncharacterized protein LOC122301650 n=1 Tax=Carya illinoinensis TaxID=32201 RepID=UPI001C721776|nr:uncharacterized protein LOC122301650 [Carya illinoinensis]
MGKQMWLKNGDRNTKFFHRAASQRKKANEIQNIKREDGSVACSREDIFDIFNRHYKSLFSTSQLDKIADCLKYVEKRVDEHMNRHLTREFTAEEVRTTLFQTNPLGSPGLDGFSAIFFQKHWDIVGEDVTKAVLEAFNAEGDMSCNNETYILLILKLVSKVIANRLKLILHQIISPTQSAFVLGRLILDNVIVAFEAMHSMSTKVKGQQGFMSLKLDMIEVLSSLLQQAEDSRLIHGIQLGRGRLSINHLFFADDSLLFCRVSAVEWAKIIELLELYESGSRQKLNKEKTSIYFSANTKIMTRDHILGMAGFRATLSYEKYLGLLALLGRSRIQAFKGILDRVRSRVSNLKNKLLSQTGKEVLLKAIIQALPTYCMGVFKLSKSLLRELNRIMHNYWWGQQQGERKTHWVSWQQMGKAKNDGGVGFKNFESFNYALLAKQAWRILQVHHSLASQVLRAKYFPKIDFLKAKVGVRPFFIWMSICSARHLIERGTISRIGNGHNKLI